MKRPTCSFILRYILAFAVLLSAPFGLARAQFLMPSATVDQEIIVVPQAALAITPGWSWGQSFTAGRSGALTRIDFQLGREMVVPHYPLQVEVRTTIGDLPELSSSGLLFSGAIAAEDVPIVTFTNYFTSSLDLSAAPPAVEPGDKLVILLSYNDPGYYLWNNSGYFYSNPYPDGTSIKKNSSTGGNWVIEENWDFGFRTWVTPIPEPADLLPLGLAFLALKRRIFV